MTRFVILTTQRSGSTVLTRTLDEHPDIFCAGEIFHESKAQIHHAEWHFPNWKLVPGKQSKVNRLVNYPNLKLNAVKHLKKFYNDSDGSEAKGFKLMYSQMKQAPFIWQFILGNKCKVIVLIRKNAFKMALSRYRMQATGTAHTTQQIQTEAINVPAQQLLQQTLQLQQVNEKLLSLSASANRLVLYYEDFADWNGMMRKTDEFLNVPYVETTPVLKKVGAGNWKSEVNNYKEIEEIFTQNNASQYLIYS